MTAAFGVLGLPCEVRSYQKLQHFNRAMWCGGPEMPIRFHAISPQSLTNWWQRNLTTVDVQKTTIKKHMDFVLYGTFCMPLPELSRVFVHWSTFFFFFGPCLSFAPPPSEGRSRKRRLKPSTDRTKTSIDRKSRYAACSGRASRHRGSPGVG